MTALYVTLFVLAPLASAKIIDAGPWQFPAGFAIMALAFAVLDLINEKHGKGQARATVLQAVAIRAFVYVVILGPMMIAPGIEPEGYDAVLGQGIRLFLWGELAMFTSQWLVDIPLFAWIRDRLHRRWFVLRYLGSTLASMTVGALIFVYGGYWGTGADPFALWQGSIVARVVMTVVLSPIVWSVREVYVGESNR